MADGVCADYAVAYRPDRAPLIVAAFHELAGAELSVQEVVSRDVDRLVVDWQR